MYGVFTNMWVVQGVNVDKTHHTLSVWDSFFVNNNLYILIQLYFSKTYREYFQTSAFCEVILKIEANSRALRGGFFKNP